MKNNLKPYFFSILTIAILAVVFATTFFYQILFVLPVLAQTDDKIVGLEGTGGQGVLAFQMCIMDGFRMFLAFGRISLMKNNKTQTN
jgi:hypothetical protein